MTYISIFDVPKAKILIKIKKFEFVFMLELFSKLFYKNSQFAFLNCIHHCNDIVE